MSASARDILELPGEIALMVFDHVEKDDLPALCLTSKLVRQLAIPRLIAAFITHRRCLFQHKSLQNLVNIMPICGESIQRLTVCGNHLAEHPNQQDSMIYLCKVFSHLYLHGISPVLGLHLDHIPSISNDNHYIPDLILRKFLSAAEHTKINVKGIYIELKEHKGVELDDYMLMLSPLGPKFKDADLELGFHNGMTCKETVKWANRTRTLEIKTDFSNKLAPAKSDHIRHDHFGESRFLKPILLHHFAPNSVSRVEHLVLDSCVDFDDNLNRWLPNLESLELKNMVLDVSHYFDWRSGWVGVLKRLRRSDLERLVLGGEHGLGYIDVRALDWENEEPCVDVEAKRHLVDYFVKPGDEVVLEGAEKVRRGLDRFIERLK